MVLRQNVIDRLGHLGYTTVVDDYDHIDYEIQRVLHEVMIYCNIDSVPEILDFVIIDRVCGDFLYYKKNAGSLDGFNYDAVIKQIKEGDTTIQYAVGQGENTPENRFDAFVNALEKNFKRHLMPYRRLRW